MQRTLEDKMTDFGYKDLNVVYEDNQIIVVIKPQNVPSQADASGDPDMLSVVKEYIKNKYNKPGNVYVGLVHRLDRPTGGLMVFARTSKSAERLCEAIKNGDFEKKYLCVTCGIPKQCLSRTHCFIVRPGDASEKRVSHAVVPRIISLCLNSWVWTFKLLRSLSRNHGASFCLQRESFGCISIQKRTHRAVSTVITIG